LNSATRSSRITKRTRRGRKEGRTRDSRGGRRMKGAPREKREETRRGLKRRYETTD
jgi:hypothetical protein